MMSVSRQESLEARRTYLLSIEHRYMNDAGANYSHERDKGKTQKESFCSDEDLAFGLGKRTRVLLED